MDRRSILRKVDKLIDNNCRVCPLYGQQNRSHSHQCTEVCEVGISLIELGREIESLSKSNILTRKILDKGPDMTTKEVKTLVDLDVPRHRISKALNLNSNSGGKLINEIVSNLKTTG